MVIISHDRHFLNGVCTHMSDLDYGALKTIVAFRAFNIPSSQRIELMSKLLVGSSNNKISGSENKACANNTSNKVLDK
jgi:ATPase subunit of ABC transporter with duplicated ATPase domains